MSHAIPRWQKIQGPLKIFFVSLRFGCVQVTVYLAHTVRSLYSFAITRPGGLKCTKIAAATNDPQKRRTRGTAGQLSVALCGLFCVFHSSFFLKGSLSPPPPSVRVCTLLGPAAEEVFQLLYIFPQRLHGHTHRLNFCLCQPLNLLQAMTSGLSLFWKAP